VPPTVALLVIPTLARVVAPALKADRVVSPVTSNVELNVAASATVNEAAIDAAPATERPAFIVASAFANNLPLKDASPLTNISPFNDKSFVIMTS